MLIVERQEKIKKIIEEKKSATIEGLAEALNVSKDTIRRDLIKLESKNIIKRTHGGAVSANREALILDYDQRSGSFPAIKRRIAEKAAAVIKENSTILFDSSTTVEAVIPMLASKSIHAITNSLTHAILLAKNTNAKISVVQGQLHTRQLYLSGADTVKKLQQYHVDYTLLGIFAISEGGVFIHTEEEGLVKREMVQRSKKVIAVADHTKIEKTGFFKVCALDEIDILVTDLKPSDDFINCLEENGVELLLTDE